MPAVSRFLEHAAKPQPDAERVRIDLYGLLVLTGFDETLAVLQAHFRFFVPDSFMPLDR